MKLQEIKKAVYAEFEVSSTKELKRLFTLDDWMDLRYRESWEALYREHVGILPGEDSDTGYGTFKGLSVLKYWRPWHFLDREPGDFGDLEQALAEAMERHGWDPEINRKLNTCYLSLKAAA